MECFNLQRRCASIGHGGRLCPFAPCTSMLFLVDFLFKQNANHKTIQNIISYQSLYRIQFICDAFKTQFAVIGQSAIFKYINRVCRLQQFPSCRTDFFIITSKRFSCRRASAAQGSQMETLQITLIEEQYCS